MLLGVDLGVVTLEEVVHFLVEPLGRQWVEGAHLHEIIILGGLLPLELF